MNKNNDTAAIGYQPFLMTTIFVLCVHFLAILILIWLGTNCIRHHFPPNSKISHQMQTFTRKELPNFHMLGIFSSMDIMEFFTHMSIWQIIVTTHVVAIFWLFWCYSDGLYNSDQICGMSFMWLSISWCVTVRALLQGD